MSRAVWLLHNLTLDGKLCLRDDKKKSGEAVKRLDRLAPNLVHVCGFVWDWTSAKYNSPLNTPGAFGGGVMESKIQKYWEVVTAGPIGTKFGTHVQIHLGIDIRQTNCPSRHKGRLGGFRVSNIQRLGKLSNGWTNWHQLWFTSADSSGNGHRLNTSRPSLPQGAFRGVLGSHKFKSLGICQTAGPINLHQTWYTSGNGHRLNTIRPSIPQGYFRGWF